MFDDYSADVSNAGAVSVGGTATGEIETGKDFDWFAVEFVAGRTYVIDLEGAGTGGGSLRNTVLRGLYDADGNRIRGTRDDNSGTGKNAQLIFTATESGTYYIEARGKREQTGDYTVRVTDATPDLGDITGLAAAESQSLSFDGTAAAVAYRRFTLTETKVVELELLGLDADADLVLEDAQGTELHASRQGGTADESLTATLTAGTYYVRMEAQAAGANEFTLRYGLSTPVPNRAPTFPEESYAFDLVENADGSKNGVSLGTVAAVDPDNDAVRYSIAAGNVLGLFEIDAHTGELFYVGFGEDYEYGVTQFALTIRASDGTLHTDTEVSVNLTDVVEYPPAFGQQTYDFLLPENADGSTKRVSLGTVSAVDPEGAAVEYSLIDPYGLGLFEIDARTGELFYVGTGEDYEHGLRRFELTIRASDGALSTRAALSVNVTDVPEQDELGGSRLTRSHSVSEGSGDDLAEDGDTEGLLAVDGKGVTGHIARSGDKDWFQVYLEVGKQYRIDLEGSRSEGGTLDLPVLLGVYKEGATTPLPGSVAMGVNGNDPTQMVTVPSSGTYYVEVGSQFQFQSGTYSSGTYTLRITNWSLNDDILAGTGTEASMVAEGDPVRGEINYSDDLDWFAVELEKGFLYKFVQESFAPHSRLNPEIYGIYDEHGVLKSGGNGNDAGDRESYYLFRPDADGTYYVAAGTDGEPASGTRHGSYWMSVRVAEFGDPGGDPAPGVHSNSTHTISAGDSVRGYIHDFNDHDWYRIRLVDNKRYKIEVEGKDTGKGTLPDPFLRVIEHHPATADFDEELYTNASDDNGGTGNNSLVSSYDPEYTGFHFLGVSSVLGWEHGTYTLTVTEVM